MSDSGVNVGDSSQIIGPTTSRNDGTINVTYNITHHHERAALPVIDSVAAQALLDRLTIDEVPVSAALPSGSHMPLSVNPLFVGREQDLLALAAALKTGATTVIAAATGMGGVGKTQLASEFAHRYGQFFAGGVFWLSFADPNGVEAEIAACGAALDLPGFAALNLSDQASRVRQLWQEATPRLLIFDNCEDEALLRSYRPTSGGCRVLVTSRRQHWDASLGVRERYLGTLPRAESVALLRQFRSDLAEDDGDLDALAHALGDLPLALHVAGSYLKRYQNAIGPALYLEKLRSAPLQAFALRALSATPTVHERDVALTVAASYERLDAGHEIDALAQAMLARAAYLAPGEPIPRELLEKTLDLSTTVVEERALAIEDALIRLDELGLSEATEGDTLRIHRLIVAFVLDVSVDSAAQAVVERALTDEGNRLVSAGFPARLAPLLAHMRHIWITSDQRGDVAAAALALALGRAEAALINPVAARSLYERALAIYEQVQGEEHPDTITSLNNLALLLRFQGEYATAKPLLERALAIREQVLGLQHPDTAISLNNLAELLDLQGDYVTARPLYELALSIFEKVLGSQHPNTATNLNNLAELLRNQGEYAASRPLYERALTIREQVLGPLHPDTAHSLSNLALLLQSQGEYTVARPLYERALSIFEQVVGPLHPDTATCLSHLASLLDSQGEYAAAKPLYERSLAIYEQVFGPLHFYTAQTLSNLALLLQSQGEYAEARPLHERALAIYECALSPNHLDTAISLNNLALLLDSQGEYTAAKLLCARSLVISEARLGLDHPTTKTIRRNLAGLDGQS